MFGGDQFRTGELGLPGGRGQVDGAEQRHEEKETPEAGAEGSGGQIQRADIGHLGRLRLEGGGTVVIPPPGQAS